MFLIGFNVIPANATNTVAFSGGGYFTYIGTTVVEQPGPGGTICAGEAIIPDTILTIGEYAFYDTAVTSVIISNSVTTIEGDAFSSTPFLTSITIPNSVTIIGNFAFYQSALNSVTIGNQVATIGSLAFFANTSLTTINFLGNAPSTADDAFSDIGTGATANVVFDATGFASNGSDWKGLTISRPCYTGLAGVVTSGSSCSGDVVLDNSVTSIGAEAFGGNNAITSVTLPDSVIEIGSYSFYNCPALVSINIPSSVASIGEWVFYGTALTSVTIPDSVISLGEGAFSDITTLTNVTIGNGLIFIPEYAFYNTRLVTVTIPNSVQVILDSAFQSIPTLTSVTIGNSLVELGDSFSNNPLLSSVTFLGNAPHDEYTNANAFYGAAMGAAAYVGADATGFTLVDGLWRGLIVSYSLPPAGDSDSSTPKVIKTVAVEAPDAEINAKNGRSLTKREIKTMLDKKKTFKNYPIDKYKYSIFGSSKKICAINGNYVVTLEKTGACEMWVTRTTAKGAKYKYWVKINYLK